MAAPEPFGGIRADQHPDRRGLKQPGRYRQAIRDIENAFAEDRRKPEQPKREEGDQYPLGDAAPAVGDEEPQQQRDDERGGEDSEEGGPGRALS